jgi:hypothetical protein
MDDGFLGGFDDFDGTFFLNVALNEPLKVQISHPILLKLFKFLK